MDPTPERYTAQQLAALLGVRPQTISTWVQQGLLPKPPFHARRTTYTREHLVRGRAIRALRAHRVPLAELRRRVAQAPLAELEAAFAPPPPPVPAPATPPPAPDYPHERWQRIALLPGLELHVREDASAALLRVAQEIHRYYGPRAG